MYWQAAFMTKIYQAWPNCYFYQCHIIMSALVIHISVESVSAMSTSGDIKSKTMRYSSDKSKFLLPTLACQCGHLWLPYSRCNQFHSLCLLHKLYIFSCDQAARWMDFSVCPSVCLSVTPFWLCSHHRIIMKLSGVITTDQGNVHAKGQGQRSRSQRLQPNLAVSRL